MGDVEAREMELVNLLRSEKFLHSSQKKQTLPRVQMSK